jgi:hypothetical protein
MHNRTPQSVMTGPKPALAQGAGHANAYARIKTSNSGMCQAFFGEK